MLPTRHTKTRGQVYIGIIISLGIISILSGVVITLVLTAYRIISFTSARTNAKYIANEQIEVIRNMPFADIGTVGGIVSGILPQDQTVARNGQQYNVSISVIYIDDPFDELAPDDLLASDYKRIRVEVNWGGISNSNRNPVVLFSDVAPRGVETSTGGGTLSILVFDSQGLPVPQADVHIVAAVNPPVDETLKTGENGRLILPGARACDNCYQITVTKPTYSTDRTYSETEVTNPSKPHQSILVEQLTQISFAIDILSTLEVRSTLGRDDNFATLGNQNFRLRGDKIIGTDGQDNPVYKFNSTFTTNESGTITIPNLEWDNYQFTPLNTPTYDQAGTNPLAPLSLLANSTSQFIFASVAHSANSLLSTFTDSANNPIASVSAVLKEDGLPIATASSGLSPDPDFGQIFFPDLDASIYTLEATVSGYLDYSNNITVNGQTTEKIQLTPQ